ncbi:8771_t:CDS:2, partial [Acaulospora morrowiae]
EGYDKDSDFTDNYIFFISQRLFVWFNFQLIRHATADCSELDEVEHHPEDFDQFVAILNFLSESVIHSPDALMQDISFEIFVNICYHLPPQDLLMLACVCKNFNNMLNGNLFPICSEIWKTSRERFTVFKDMDPPRGMSQKQFVRLLNFERGCEFCKNKSNIQIYWSANVRSCKSCVLEKSKTHQELVTECQIDQRVINTIPHLIPCPDDNGRTHYYWFPCVLAAQSELGKNSEMAKDYKKPELKRLTDENIKRYRWITQCWSEQVEEQKSIVKEFIRNMGLNDFKDPIIEQMFEDVNANPFIKPDFDAYAEALRNLKPVNSSKSSKITVKREKRDDEVNAKTLTPTPPKGSKKRSSQEKRARSRNYGLPSENSTASNSSTSDVYIKTEEEPIDWHNNTFLPKESRSIHKHQNEINLKKRNQLIFIYSIH